MSDESMEGLLLSLWQLCGTDEMWGWGVYYFEKSEADHWTIAKYHHYLDISKLNWSSSFSIFLEA